MPELPEVETTRRGIEPHILNAIVSSVVIRQRQLRWPIPGSLEQKLPAQVIRQVSRRGKYLLLHTDIGCVLVHLGMSGSLRIVSADQPPRKHDHADVIFSNGKILRFHDPRKFGCILWAKQNPFSHPLLRSLGPEPLSPQFTGDYLYGHSRRRTAPVKTFIMDSRQVVGVGNIYANEALYLAGISPSRKAGTIGRERYIRLADAIKTVLKGAIKAGGTTLRDFVGGDGRPGYFSLSLSVYGRAGEACGKCGRLLREIRLGQRSTVYCPACQR